MTDKEFFEQQHRDDKRENEELKRANDCLKRALDDERRQNFKFGDYERPEDVFFQALKPVVRRWERERKQVLADLIVSS